jgi:hypothetical protein
MNAAVDGSQPVQSSDKAIASPRWEQLKRTREAVGTVYGDIGTSVLYTIMEITRQTVELKYAALSEAERAAIVTKGGALLAPSEVMGGLSLVIWALIFLTVKYDLLIMRADHRGEGGTFALWGLLKGYTGKILSMGLDRLPCRGRSRIASSRRNHHAADQHVGRVRTTRRKLGGCRHADQSVRTV